ncbi:unnamed protein product [Echinostoma caproni]|uniref:VIT domain-containing protein n=1 Tax=Echinostoma caproni TaxID=27848 RepID=A0A183B421_9TREM|nr:unnamed protein product [Echinostoma caproni]
MKISETKADGYLKLMAKTTYEEAVSTGHMAFMAEQDEHCEDLFQLKLGAIPSKAKVTVRIKYVGLIDAENTECDGKKQSIARFTLPTVLNPRYRPQDMNKGEFQPLSEEGGLKPYVAKFHAEINMPLTVVSVTSPVDKFDTEWTSSDHKMAKVKLTSELKGDHDFQMIIHMDGHLSTFAVCEHGHTEASNILGMDCLMTQWMPDFSQFQHKQELRTELFFIIDRSGELMHFGWVASKGNIIPPSGYFTFISVGSSCHPI